MGLYSISVRISILYLHFEIGLVSIGSIGTIWLRSTVQTTSRRTGETKVFLKIKIIIMRIRNLHSSHSIISCNFFFYVSFFIYRGIIILQSKAVDCQCCGFNHVRPRNQIKRLLIYSTLYLYGELLYVLSLDESFKLDSFFYIFGS